MKAVNQFGISLIDPRNGIMDSDSAFSKIKQGNYVNAFNINSVSQGANTQGNIMPCVGDMLAYNIAAITAQSKQYQFVINCSAAVTGAIVVLNDANGNQIGSNVVFNISETLATTISNFETAFSAQTSGFSITYGSSTQTAQVTITVIMDLTSSAYGWEWYAVSSNVNISITVLAEAIDASITGNQYPLASYEDVNHNLFIWSTTVNVLPTNIVVSGAVSVGGLIKLTVASTANIVEHSSIIISGIVGTTEANGVWICHIVDATHVELLNSSFSNAYSSGGTVSINTEGYGQVGVAVKNYNNNTWTYTKLLGSKEWNWRTAYQIDGDAVIANGIWCFYWTNNNEVPRNMYYQGTFFANGGISTTVPPTGVTNYSTYTYGNISNETTLIQSNDTMSLAYSNQITGGGTISSGNWRYFICGVTASGLNSNPTFLTNPIPVFSADANVGQSPTANAIFGDDAGTPTTKINVFNVNNIISNAFEYVDLYGINYTGNGSEQCYRITRILLPTNATSFQIQHSGNETDTYTVDDSTANIYNTSYATAATLRLFNNRLALGNVTQNNNLDFRAHAQSIALTCARYSMPSIGVTAVAANNQKVGEYEDPDNVCNYMGYMINETYRFAAQYHIINQGWTDAYWIEDIKICTANADFDAFDSVASVQTYDGGLQTQITLTNGFSGLTVGQYVNLKGFVTNTTLNGTFEVIHVTSSTVFQIAIAYPGQTDTGEAYQLSSIALSTLDLTDSPIDGTNIVYVPYIFANIPTNAFINGKPLNQIVDQIQIVRVDMTTGNFIEVLATGVTMLGVSGTSAESYALDPGHTSYGDTTGNIYGAYNCLFEENFTVYPNDFTAQKKFGTFYSPDMWWGNTNINWLTGDKIYNYGTPLANLLQVPTAADQPAADDSLIQYNGYFGGVVDSDIPQVSITAAQEINYSNISIGGVTYSTQYIFAGVPPIHGDTLNGQWTTPPALVINNSVADFGNPKSQTDYGLRYFQYFRQTRCDSLDFPEGSVQFSQPVRCRLTVQCKWSAMVDLAGCILACQSNVPECPS